MHSFRFSVYFRRNPRKNRKGCFRFLENVLARAYHKVTRFFRNYYFRFLPSKPEVIVPVWCNIEWINADFSKTNFSPRNLLIQRSLRCETSAFLRWISGLGEAQQVFLNLKKSDSKIASWYQLALFAAVANAKTSWAKNNRPLQVELENGRSWSQNDFQIWKAHWEAS